MKQSKLSRLASAMPFAHYLGLNGSAAHAEEDDDRKQRDDESDEDYAKRMEEQDKEDEDARRAEEEQRDRESRAEEEDDDAKRAEEDGDEQDDKDDKESGRRAGRAKGARQRERIRCARIVAAGIKAGLVNQACVFAFDSNLTAPQAITALSAAKLDAPASRQSAGLRERMSAVRTPNVGAEAAPAAPPNAAQLILAANEKRLGRA